MFWGVEYTWDKPAATALAKVRRVGEGWIDDEMPGDGIHVPAPARQIINFAEIGIINNLSDSAGVSSLPFSYT